MELALCRRRYALAFGHRDARNPDDFLAVRNHRQAVTDLSRNMGINQDVLPPLGLLEAKRAHPVARFAGGDRKREAYAVRIEVGDLVASLEARGVAGAGGRAHGGRFRRLRRRLREARCFAAPPCLDLQEAGAGDQPANDPALQRGWKLGERVAICSDVLGKAGDLRLEETILLAEDVGGAGQQLASRRIEGVNGREELLSQPVARETRVGVTGVAARGEVEPAQVGLDVVPRDVEQRPGKVAVTAAHRGEPARSAAPKQVEEKGLHLVIQRMAERDGGTAGLGCRLADEGMARGPGGVFSVWGAGRRARGVEVKAPRRRNRGDEVAIVLAVGAPAVVEMRDREMKRHDWKDL